MEKEIEFVKQIVALNGLMGANWLFDQIKKIFPESTYLEMGYDGGYSPRIIDGQLLDYNGNPYKGTLDVHAFLNDKNGEFGLGTINVDIKNEDDCPTQLYHDGRKWHIETFEGDTFSGKDAREILEKFNAWRKVLAA